MLLYDTMFGTISTRVSVYKCQFILEFVCMNPWCYYIHVFQIPMTIQLH